MERSSEFCAGCPFSGNYADEVTHSKGVLEVPEGSRNTDRLVLRFTDVDGLQTNACSVSVREQASGTITEEVRELVVTRAVSRVVRCSGPGVTTEGRSTCRAVNETVLPVLLKNVIEVVQKDLNQ